MTLYDKLEEMVITKTHKDVRLVLMEPKRRGVKESYYLIKEDEQVIFVVSPGLNGSEFNKTEGYFSNYPSIQLYQCLYGQGVLLMQRNDEQGEAKEFKVVTLNPGKQAALPADWAMCLVNVGKSFLVVIKIGGSDSKYLNNEPIIEKQGLAYYVIEKKGEIAFEINSNYRILPQITTE